MSLKSPLTFLPSLVFGAFLANAAEPVIIDAVPIDSRMARIEGMSSKSLCNTWLTATGDDADGSYEKEAKTFRQVRQLLPRFYTPEKLREKSWVNLLDRFGAPSAEKLSPAITMVPFSDSNMGKSTWVNKTVAMLSGQTRAEFQNVVPVGFESGSTKRTIVVMSDAAARGRGNIGPAIQSDISIRYDNPKAVDVESVLRETGPAVVRVASTLPDNMEIVLVDSPDMSSGPVGKPTPQYQEAVNASILPADIMVFMLNKSNYNRQSFKEAVRNVFNTNGARASVIIWQGDASGIEHLVHGFIRQFAEEIYDMPSGPTGLPEGVLGAYWTPEINAVRDQDEFPNYVPFDPFPEYVDLLQQVRDNADAVKRFSIRHALKRIQVDVRDMISDETRRIHAAEIWSCALDSAIATMARGLQERVPYEDIRSPVREKFYDLKSDGITRAVHKIVYKFIHAFRETVAAMKPNKMDAERDRQLSAELFENKMTLFVQSFRDGIVNLIATPPAEDSTNSRIAGTGVEAWAKKYKNNFGLARTRQLAGLPPPDGHVTVELPPLEHLPPEARVAIEKFLRTDVRTLAAQLQHKLRAYINLDASKIRSNDQEVMNALREEVKGKVIGAQPFIDYTTALGLLGGAQQLFTSGDLHLMWSLGFFVGAKFWYEALDAKREENIRLALSQYFGRKQYEVTRDFLTQQLADLRGSLKTVEQEHLDALSAMQDALAISDKDVPKFSYSIEVAPDAGSATPVDPTRTLMFQRDYTFWNKKSQKTSP